MNWRTIIKKAEPYPQNTQKGQKSPSNPGFANSAYIAEVNPALKSTDSELVKCGACRNFEFNPWARWGIGECDKDLPQPGDPAWPNEPRVCNQWKQKGHVV